ncbi:zinc finger CW-type PWWP domain protein 1-like [Heterodontus francisci]|uniref:zinc finger CW-type PWWP domain protein 1-like n=1 Tax=Heterodontus francisci TaxID=7792 RepID=UPI00355B2178
MNQVKLLRELRYRERTMKDFEELRKLCCADIPGAIEVSAASNGIEKSVKRGTSFVASGGKDNILKLKKKKEVLCENSSAVIEGQNGDSSEGTRPDMEKRGQKNFTLKKKKAVFEKRQAKPYLEEGCITKPGKISDEEKVKSKTKCIGGITKTNKTIPTLSDSQYEKLFQSVIDKSLEECIASSKKLMHKVKSLQENSEMLLVSENTVPSEPLVTKGNEDVETQGVRKTKTKSKDKKVNKLSRKNKILTNTSEINEVNREGRKHKRKGQPKKIVQDYTKFIDDDEETTLDNYVAWVQCSRKKCGKWRRLEDNVDPATLPQDWICSQNPDPLYNMCDLPEEVWDGRENDIIYAELVPGSIVWAKQLGYPWWPGMVEHDPQTGKYFMFTSDSDQFPSKYHVTFFDTTVSHAWIPVPLIKSFQEIPLEKNISKRDFTKRINAGKKMAEEAQKVKIQDRLSHFGFVVRYKGNGDAELSEDNSSQESMETPCNVKDSNRPKSRKKEDIWSEDSAEKEPIVTETHQQKARKGINHINADPKRRRKQESPVQLVRKAFPTRSKLFRDPTVKRSSTGNNRKAAEKTAVSNGIKEPELGVLKPKVTDAKTAGHDHVKSNSCLNPDLLSMELSVATDMNVEERSMEQKVLYKDPMTPRRDGPNNEDFTQLLQEVMENKQDADMFSDDDMAILTLKKSEEEEEFAEFMFEE